MWTRRWRSRWQQVRRRPGGEPTVAARRCGAKARLAPASRKPCDRRAAGAAAVRRARAGVGCTASWPRGAALSWSAPLTRRPQVDVKVAVPKELAVPRAAAAAPPLAAAPRSCKARWRARVVPLCSCAPSAAPRGARRSLPRLNSRAPRRAAPHAPCAAQIFVGGLAPTTTEGARPPQLQRHLPPSPRRRTRPSHCARAPRPRCGSGSCGDAPRRFGCHAPCGAPRRFAPAVPPLTRRVPSTDAFRAHFAPFGAITDAVVMVEPASRRPRGFGFITFANEDAVDRCAHLEASFGIWRGALGTSVLMRAARARAAACSPRAQCRSWRASAWRSSARCLGRSCLRHPAVPGRHPQPRPLPQQPPRAAPAPRAEQRRPRRSRMLSQR